MAYRGEQEEEKEETLATPGVLDKYQSAGKIANSVLQQVIDKVKPGLNMVDICAFGDKEINTQLSKVYNKNKKMEKGIAFPTCLSVNEICGHYSPLVSDANEKEKESATLKQGDVVKIDLGVHIDGYMALVAHTVVCSDNSEDVVTGRKADAVLAAWNSAQVALRLLKPGQKNNEVTALMNKVSASYKCNELEGLLSHELKKHLIDGNNVIISREQYDQKVDEHEFQVNEIFALDVIVSTGEGKTKETELRTTVHKRAMEKNYTLKTKHGRTFMHEIIEKFPSLCFSLRSFEDEITAKLGVSECSKHDLLVPYPVLTEKAGETVAQFKFTVLLLQNGTLQLTGLPLNEAKFQTENKITDEKVLELLKVSMDLEAQKKDKKKQKKQQVAETPVVEETKQ